jgi:hypothetical protein
VHTKRAQQGLPLTSALLGEPRHEVGALPLSIAVGEPACGLVDNPQRFIAMERDGEALRGRVGELGLRKVER